jgi:hypothetical protein
MTSNAIRGCVVALATLGFSLGCGGPSVESNTGGPTGGSTGGGTTGATISIVAAKGLQFNAGFSGSYGPIALAAAAGEGELFFGDATDAGYSYFLQHLSTAGKAAGGTVEVASGTPEAPPRVAVSSNGAEVACCWEDFGSLGPSNPTPAAVTRCNSVPVTGKATDAAMDGGFGGLGSNPALARGADSTALALAQSGAGVSEAILYGSQTQATFNAPFIVPALQIAPLGNGFTLFLSDGGALELSQQASDLKNDGGLQPVPNGASGGSFAVATNSIPTLPAVTAVLMHQGSSVVTTLLGTSNPTAIAVSSAGEQPLDALAAVACNPGTFAFAYALDGGAVGVREVSTQGGLAGTGTVVPSFGASVTSVSLAAVDGGILIAAGNADNLAVYSAPCP